MLNSGPFRILLACILGISVGFLFFNETLNPVLMKIWKNEYYPGVSDPSKFIRFEIALASTVAGILVLSICMNQYVNYMLIKPFRLLRISLELWLMYMCLQVPHVLWTSQSVRGFAIDQIYNILLISTISFAVGFNRFGRNEKKIN